MLITGFFFGKSKKKIVPIYLAGVNEGDNRTYKGSMGKDVQFSLRNWHMDKYFGEKKMNLIGGILTTAMIIIGTWHDDRNACQPVDRRCCIMIIKTIISVIAYLILAPFVGGFLAGLDRKLSARMQRRVGPPVLQPFYDVFKLVREGKADCNESAGLLCAGIRHLRYGIGCYILCRRRHAARDLYADGSKCVPDHSCLFIQLALCAGGSGTRTAADDGI